MNDRDVLRALAQEIADIAALPVQQQTTKEWKSLNALNPTRPMVKIDQIPWHEMDVNGELTLQTEDPFSRLVETELRQIIYAWKHMPVDMVVEPVVRLRKRYSSTGFGVREQEDIAVKDPNNCVVGHRYYDHMKTEADAKQIRTPEIVMNHEGTAEREAWAHDIFDSILDVHMTGTTCMFAPWDKLVHWMSPEGIFYNLIDRPEFVHQVMEALTNALLAELDQLEALGLLEPYQPLVHCTGAYTDELPAEGFNPERPRPRDIWSAGQAQIFSTVSPEMHQEFDLDYAARWYERFGLVYYGCCEPLDGKLDIVRKIPNLRKISMSPWVSQEKGAQQIGPDFVFSRKPSPALLAGEHWNPSAVEKDLIETRDTCAKHGCPLEFILKDVSTVAYEPQRLWEWAEIAKRVATESSS